MSSVSCLHCGSPASEFDVRCPRCRAPLRAGQRAFRHSLATDPAALVGSRLSGYSIEAVLGHGSMAVVYKASDPSATRSVALKVLAPSRTLDDVPAGNRFRREARAATALDHPNVGRVLAIDESDGRTFLVMEYFEGRTLAQRLEHGALAVAEAVRILRGVASGLGAVHAAGIVHRDLKPANVMLTSSGGIKLLDFGLALVVKTDSTQTPLTQTGQILGTLAYMAPEQIHAERLDERTDLWSFGVIAYEALSGRRPFQALTGAGVMDQILKAEPVPLGVMAPDLPQVLDTLVMGLLRKDRSRRIGTTAEVLEALELLPMS